jgi:NADH-quinone oxidoreductase subunit N
VGEFNYLQQLPAIAPEIGLTILAIVVLALDLYLPESRRKGTAYVAAFGLLGLAVVPFIWSPDSSIETLWGGMVRYDVLAQVFKVMVLIAAGITCLIASSTSDLARKGEFYLIIIVSTLGASLLSSSSDIIMIFVALETLSIPLYILAAFRKSDSRSIESGMKYFLFGSFASAIMLYGFSLLYGFTGHTNIHAIADYMTAPEFGLNAVPIVVSLILIFVGFGFKISAVPFHFWTPDVYEGAPTPVTAFVSVASKAASMAVLMRFLIAIFPAEFVINGQVMQEFWIQLIIVLAVISMTVGNVLALVQKNIKRMLAYSSIAQAGYVLIGMAAIQSIHLTDGVADISQSSAAQGVAAVAFYMFMYTFTNLLAFAVIVIFTEATGSESISDLAGLSRRNPWLALAMTVGLLSLAGIPPAAGFFGKFFLFNAAVTAGLEWLAIVGVLNAIIALYYYLVVIKVIYVDRHEDDEVPIALNMTTAWVLGATTIIVIVLGVLPQAIYNWALSSASTLFA